MLDITRIKAHGTECKTMATFSAFICDIPILHFFGANNIMWTSYVHRSFPLFVLAAIDYDCHYRQQDSPVWTMQQWLPFAYLPFLTALGICSQRIKKVFSKCWGTTDKGDYRNGGDKSGSVVESIGMGSRNACDTEKSTFYLCSLPPPYSKI